MSLYKGEKGYLRMIKDLLETGVPTPDRTGVGTIAQFDAKLVFDHRYEGMRPLMAHRPLPIRKAFEEFWFFLHGKTQTKELEAEGVDFWRPNTTREFLDNRGLTHLPEGDMGRAYGAQFRRYSASHFDQLTSLVKGLRDDPYSRRHYVTFWNPEESGQMALPPCWHSHQFVVLPEAEGDVLHLKLLNRSLDSVLGFSAAIHGYGQYQQAMANLLGMQPGKLSADLSQYHLYQDQLRFTEEMVQREIGEPGCIEIERDLVCLDDLLNLTWEDIKIVGRCVNDTPFDTPVPGMAA